MRAVEDRDNYIRHEQTKCPVKFVIKDDRLINLGPHDWPNDEVNNKANHTQVRKHDTKKIAGDERGGNRLEPRRGKDEVQDRER
mmetsp:Transcript_18740/g.43020  ORF Transcript_18740/g.43020 Transcript_18740/m.43020 type:complete len:84 (-) Transcript_18740:39-290(-)